MSDTTSTIAERHGVSTEAVEAAFAALRNGHGSMAQFTHPDFGGMAQWSSGGMSMVGDMFNRDLKARLDGVMGDLVELLRKQGNSAPRQASPPGEEPRTEDKPGNWWPSSLGAPSSTGGQNEMRYAIFPDKRRLVIDDGRRRTIYDTGSHQIHGISQQQSGDRTISFTSQAGPVKLADLAVVG